jgi:cation diffusion facilitator family transporter
MPVRRSARDRNVQVRRVLAGLLLANLGVVGAKVVIGLGTGALSVLGDAVHSSVDAMNNVIGLAIIAVAARGPDEDHPYGHQKFETVGALAIVIFLSVTGFEIVKGAITQLHAGATPLDISGAQLALLIGTLGINTVVAWYENRRGHELHSEILLADAAHTRADVFVTTGVLIGVVAADAGVAWADPVVALGVAGMIVWLAYGILARSIPVLVDEQAVPASEIQSAAEAIGGVERAYDIRSRGGSSKRFAELTIAVDAEASVAHAHEIADAVELAVRNTLQLHEVVVHVEPC